MPFELILYFGVITLIGVGALLLFVVMSIRADRMLPKTTTNRDLPAIPRSGPRVQVILPELGKPLLWIIDGQIYTHISHISDSTHLTALAEFLAKMQVVSQAPQELPLSLPRSTRREDELDQPLLERIRVSFFKPAPKNSEVLTTSSPVLKKPFEQRKQSTMGPKVEELDAIVQGRMALLPHAPSTTIQLGASGLLEIVVGGQRYERIDDVREEQIRTILREAVKIWESRM